MTTRQFLFWIPACCAVLLLHHTQLAAGDVYLEQSAWMINHGGVVNARVDHGPDGLRGLYATKAIAAGEDILVIPETTIINAGSTEGSIMTPILTYLREQHAPGGSRFQPYLATLPDGASILNACQIPLQYVQMLQAPFWEEHVLEWQEHLQHALSGVLREQMEYTFEDMLGDVNVTLEEVQRACAVVSTRYVHNSRARLSLAPVFDMCNHRRGCPQYMLSGHRGALHLVAGEDLEPGEEVCYGYGSMRDDYAAFYYGFLPAEEHPPRLLAVDHHEFSDQDARFDLSDEPFKGTPDEVQAEVARLTTILQGLEAAPPPSQTQTGCQGQRQGQGQGQGQDQSPTQGLGAACEGFELMVQLRRRRVQALRHELARLGRLSAQTPGASQQQEL